MVSKMRRSCNKISNVFAIIIIAMILELIIVNLSIGYGLMYQAYSDSIEKNFRGFETILYPIRMYLQRLIFFSGPVAVLSITIKSCVGENRPCPCYLALLKVVFSYLIPFVLCIPAYYVSECYNFGNPSYYFYPYILFGFVPALICAGASVPVVYFAGFIKASLRKRKGEGV